MTEDEKEVFNNVVSCLQSHYPSTDLRVEGNYVKATVYDRDTMLHTEKTFNISGYCLLYCLSELCKLLKDKLR